MVKPGFLASWRRANFMPIHPLFAHLVLKSLPTHKYKRQNRMPTLVDSRGDARDLSQLGKGVPKIGKP